MLGSTSVLCHDIVEKILESNTNNSIFGIGRKHSKNIPLSNFIKIDMLNRVQSQFSNLEEVINKYDEIYLFALAATLDTSTLTNSEILQINYVGIIDVIELFERICIDKQVVLNSVLILSSTALLPNKKVPQYSASKAALFNYAKFKLNNKHYSHKFFGIFVGPFKSPLWDDSRMKKLGFLSKSNLFFNSKIEANRVWKIISRRSSGIFPNYLTYFAGIRSILLIILEWSR